MSTFATDMRGRIQSVSFQCLELLRRLANNLSHEKFFPGEYGSQTVILGHRFDGSTGPILTEMQMEEGRKSLLLQIREHGYSKFVKLPAPAATEMVSVHVDSVSHISLRFVRSFYVNEGIILNSIDVGMNP